MATSAIWKATWRRWLTTFAPILISLSLRLVSDQSLIGSDGHWYHCLNWVVDDMLGAAVMVVMYSRLTDPIYLLIACAVMGFFVNGMLGGYGALISELYPTVADATFGDGR